MVEVDLPRIPCTSWWAWAWARGSHCPIVFPIRALAFPTQVVSSPCWLLLINSHSIIKAILKINSFFLNLRSEFELNCNRSFISSLPLSRRPPLQSVEKVNCGLHSACLLLSTTNTTHAKHKTVTSILIFKKTKYKEIRFTLDYFLFFLTTSLMC